MVGMKRRKVTERRWPDKVQERKSVCCKMRKRILIFKQLFFLNFQSNYETKICCHYISQERNQPNDFTHFKLLSCSYKRSSSSIDLSSSPPPLPHLSPNTSPSSRRPHPPLPCTFIFLPYSFFPPSAHFACLALVFMSRYLSLYLYLFILIVSSLLSQVVQFFIVSLTVITVLFLSLWSLSFILSISRSHSLYLSLHPFLFIIHESGSERKRIKMHLQLQEVLFASMCVCVWLPLGSAMAHRSRFRLILLRCAWQD